MDQFRIIVMLLLHAVWFPMVSRAADDEARTWTDSSGRELEATFLYFHEGLVGLRLASGREAAVGIGSLSRVDQEFVFDQNAERVFEMQSKGIPEMVSLKDHEITVTGGPAVFETEWFRFENDEAISSNFVREAAQVFEATRLAIASLPLGLDARPSEGTDKFHARFVLKKNFQSFLKNSPGISTPHKIAGVYDPKLKSVIVPYDQLGARKKGELMTLNRSSDSSTLIHEITHQVMHDQLPLTPIWLSEGFAEYMASIPYEDGAFDFSRAVEGLKDRMRYRHGSLKVKIPGLQVVLEMGRNDWRGRSTDYSSSLIYTFYFMHLDQPSAQGSPLAAYFHLLDQAKNETHRMIAEYNDAVMTYNNRVIVYNREIAQYKKQAAAYQEEVRAYNQKVDDYNEQLKRGALPSSRTFALGKRPTPPDLPEEPGMPEILKNQKLNSPIDLFEIANNRARPSLLRERDYESLEDEVRVKMAALGIDISFF